jgi:hypothetical protein
MQPAMSEAEGAGVRRKAQHGENRENRLKQNGFLCHLSI